MPPPSIVTGWVIVTGPKSPGACTLITLPEAVCVEFKAPLKVRQGLL
jgi:hypothetical protein